MNFCKQDLAGEYCTVGAGGRWQKFRNYSERGRRMGSYFQTGVAALLYWYHTTEGQGHVATDILSLSVFVPRYSARVVQLTPNVWPRQKVWRLPALQRTDGITSRKKGSSFVPLITVSGLVDRAAPSYCSHITARGFSGGGRIQTFC